MSVFTTHPGIDWTDHKKTTLVELIAAVEEVAENDVEVRATLRQRIPGFGPRSFRTPRGPRRDIPGFHPR